jgi:D-3-phosphoglycerate dehydrogenase
VDVDGEVDETELIAELRAIEGTLKTRFLYPENGGDCA